MTYRRNQRKKNLRVIKKAVFRIIEPSERKRLWRARVAGIMRPVK